MLFSLRLARPKLKENDSVLAANYLDKVRATVSASEQSSSGQIVIDEPSSGIFNSRPE